MDLRSAQHLQKEPVKTATYHGVAMSIEKSEEMPPSRPTPELEQTEKGMVGQEGAVEVRWPPGKTRSRIPSGQILT